MVYTPFPTKIADRWAEAFEKKTGIHVTQIKEGTTKVYSRLRAEKAYPRADVWIGGGGMVPFISAAREGLLEPYKPKGREQLAEKRGNLILRDAQWRWVGAAIIGLGFAYNPQRTKPEELPKRWEDLADPRFKDEIIMWDPADSGTAMLFLAAALQRSRQATGSEEAGWKYLKGFYHNLKRYAAEGPPSLMVSRGEIKIGIHFEHQVLNYVRQSEDPKAISKALESLRWTILPSSPVIMDPVALVHGAPHADNGRKFIDFLFTTEGQKIINDVFFVTDPTLGPPKYLDYTLKGMLGCAMPLDAEWMGASYDRIRTRWQNEVETSRWLWEDSTR